MSRPGRPPRSQQRPLSDEDVSLWQLVTGGLKPVRRKPRVHPMVGEEDVRSAPASSSLPMPEPAPREPAGSPPQRKGREAPRARKTPQATAAFDRRQVRKIATGRIEIEARLDLHGLSASEAHAALHAFILSSFSKDRRHVLVITGKGEPDMANRPFEMPCRSRGVLKRQVPLWLNEPGLREVVVGHTVAHARHGGEGALYVQLRSRRRAGRSG